MMSPCSFALLLVFIGVGYATKLERDAACSAGSEPCFEGLKCEGGRCVANEEASLCHKKLLASHEDTALGRFIPKCTEEGHFSPQQCHGSVCYCTDKDGSEIKDFAKVPIHRSKEQTCQCAQDLAEYKKLGIIGRLFSCDTYGNYKKVQCFGSECYCVDPFGKALLEVPSVHISQIHTLKC